MPGASLHFTVPAGQSRCVKLLFTAETACGLTAGPDFCYVRALIDAAPMDPDGAGFQAIDSEDGSAGAHAYEWVKRVGPGAHVDRARRPGCSPPATPFWLDDWTFDVQQYLSRPAGRWRDPRAVRGAIYVDSAIATPTRTRSRRPWAMRSSAAGSIPATTTCRSGWGSSTRRRAGCSSAAARPCPSCCRTCCCACAT